MRISALTSFRTLCATTLFFTAVTPTSVFAQSGLPVFDHIVVIVQENRTPDNLFGSTPTNLRGCNGQDDFEPGVDIQTGATLALRKLVFRPTHWDRTPLIRITPMVALKRCVTPIAPEYARWTTPAAGT